MEDPNILNNINVNLRNVKTEQDGTAAEEGETALIYGLGADPTEGSPRCAWATMGKKFIYTKF